MGAAAAGTRVFLEVRRRLQSALLVFGEPKEGGMSMDISITPCSLQVKTPEGCTELQLPAEVRLVPSSCGGLRYVPGDGLHLRLQVRAESNAKLVSMFNQSSQAQECCTFYCQSCGEVIIRDRELIRVLPLPSENWGALVEEWCCHPDPFANKPLHPQENDCFIGDSFFLVNLRSDLWQPRPELAPVETCCPSSENHFKLKPKANTKVICKRCKVMLGETMSSETTKLYMTEIIIQPSERNFPIIPRSQFVQSVIAQCLVELSTARSTFRFTVQGHDGKVYILLWILNSDSLVIESLRSSKSIKKFSLLEDVLKADSGSAWNAVKVLYQPCIKSRNEKLSSAWESDISIHSLTLPSATCLELLLILSRNNATLPPSLRYMNSFQKETEAQGGLRKAIPAANHRAGMQAQSLSPHCGPSPLGCQLIASETVTGFTECCETMYAFLNLPAGGLFEDVMVGAEAFLSPEDSSLGRSTWEASVLHGGQPLQTQEPELQNKSIALKLCEFTCWHKVSKS